MTKSVPAFLSSALGLFAIGALAASLPQPARADEITVPPVPGDIQVLEPNEVFLVGHAVGSQNYVCQPAGSGFAWTLFTPEATLFSEDLGQLITHFNSPNPAENSLVRPTWQHSKDTSAVWAKVAAASTDSRFVARGAIAWVKLEKAGVLEGPTGGDVLTKTTFVQRLNTAGGVAPSTGCASFDDVGKRAFVPYTADYFFYMDPTAQK